MVKNINRKYDFQILSKSSTIAIYNVIYILELGAQFPYEWCIGVNGRVWVSTLNPQITSLICRILPKITFLTNDQIKKLVTAAAKTINQ